MSDYNNNGSGRPQGRGRGGRRRTGGQGNRSHTPRDDSANFRLNRNKKPELSGFEKFLKIITFGFYKPAALPDYPKPVKKAPTELGPIARKDREDRQKGRREGGRENRGEGREGRPPRPSPVATEVTNERLYVGNLSYDATESDLQELFSGSGNVKNAEVVVNSRTQRSKGFAFVTMMTVDEAKKAVADLNSRDFMGRPLVVGGAKPMTPREDRDSNNRDYNDPDAITRPEEDDEEAEKVNA